MVRLPFWSVELVFRLLLSGKGWRTQFAPTERGLEEDPIYVNKCYFYRMVF